MSPATLAYAPTSTDVLETFNAWKTWKMADLDICQGPLSSTSSMFALAG